MPSKSNDKDKKSAEAPPAPAAKKDDKALLGKVSLVAQNLQSVLEDDNVPHLLDRPDLKPRWVAGLIDGLSACGLVFLFFAVGIVAGGFYTANVLMIAGAVFASIFMLARDGLYKSASPGKLAVGLRVVDEEEHFIGIGTSIKRNVVPALPFMAIVVYGVLNLLYEFIGAFGTLASMLVGLGSAGAILYETYTLLLDRENSRRRGDVSAGTKVIELDD